MKVDGEDDDDVDDDDVDDEDDGTLISLTRKRRKAAGKAKQKAAAVERSEACLCLPARGIAAIGGGARARALSVDRFDSVRSEKVCNSNHSNHNSNHSNHA